MYTYSMYIEDLLSKEEITRCACKNTMDKLRAFRTKINMTEHTILEWIAIAAKRNLPGEVGLRIAHLMKLKEQQGKLDCEDKPFVERKFLFEKE